jgi:hypothetical protein
MSRNTANAVPKNNIRKSRVSCFILLILPLGGRENDYRLIRANKPVEEIFGEGGYRLIRANKPIAEDGFKIWQMARFQNLPAGRQEYHSLLHHSLPGVTTSAFAPGRRPADVVPPGPKRIA